MTKNSKNNFFDVNQIGDESTFGMLNYFEFWMYFKMWNLILSSQKKALSLHVKGENEVKKAFANQIATIIREDEAKVSDALEKLTSLKLAYLKGNYLRISEMDTKTSTNGLKKPKRFNFSKKMLELGAHPRHIEDWLEVRKKKKASNTLTSFDAFVKECKAANISVHEAVKICAEKGWAGFNHKWIKDERSTINRQTEATIRSNTEGWEL